MSFSVELTVVVPHDSVTRMANKGFKMAKRQNAYTATMYHLFQNEAEAHAVGHKLLPFVWGVERQH